MPDRRGKHLDRVDHFLVVVGPDEKRSEAR